VERPPPPVTVSVPGRTVGPVEVLADGGPPDRPPLPRWARPVAAGAAGLALVALAGAQGRQEAPSPAPSAEPAASTSAPAFVRPPARGVAATVALRRGGPDAPYAERLTISVALRGADAGGVRYGPAQEVPVRLLEVVATGFEVGLAGRRAPVDLGVLDPRSLETVVVPLQADIVVTDCSVSTEAPRAVSLRLQRGDRRPDLVRATVERPVVRVLDRLVSRTCRRPRG